MSFCGRKENHDGIKTIQALGRLNLVLRELVQNLNKELAKDVLTIPVEEDAIGLHTVREAPNMHVYACSPCKARECSVSHHETL